MPYNTRGMTYEGIVRNTKRDEIARSEKRVQARRARVQAVAGKPTAMVVGSVVGMSERLGAWFWQGERPNFAFAALGGVAVVIAVIADLM